MLWLFVVEIIGTFVEVICIIMHYVNKQNPKWSGTFERERASSVKTLSWDGVLMQRGAGPPYLWVSS